MVSSFVRCIHFLTFVLLNPDIPCLCKLYIQISWLPKKPTDLDLHCLSFIMWIYINNLDQVIWLAENWKWAWHLNLFSMTRVKRLVLWVKLSAENILKYISYFAQKTYFDSSCKLSLLETARLAPVVFVLYLFLSFSTLFFFYHDPL